MLETQYEKFLVINNRVISHDGTFVIDEVFQLINKVLQERHYARREKRSEDSITEEGHSVFVELRPWKEKTHYVTLKMTLKIHFTGVRNVVREIQGMKKAFQEGEASVIMDAWYMTEWEYRWGMKPLMFFLKGVINKLVYVFPQEAGYKDELVEDAAYLTARLKQLFRSYREPEVALPPEEDVRKAVEEEIKNTLSE